MTLEQFSLAGKKALVTGASRGIGQVIAAAFAQAGAGVAISARGAHGLATTAAPFLPPSGAAQGAVVSLTKTLATEWGRAGVRVNALCPGWTATELNRMRWETPDGGQATIANVPTGRWARPGRWAAPPSSWPATPRRS